jgi:DNA-binding beta-propeller fold protein YncE
MATDFKSIPTLRPAASRIVSWSRLKKPLVITALLGVLAILAVVGTMATRFAFPRTPRSIAHLEFKGFIALPKPTDSGYLSVMDYLTIEDRSLYVASIKPGAVFKVPLDGTFPPLKSDIAVIPGAPSAHGVVFGPKSSLGFISRSDTNVVDIFDTSSLQITKSIPVSEGVDGIFYDPFNKLIYAASGDAKMATLIDPATQSSVGQITLAGKPEFAVFDPLTSLMYQNLKDTNVIAVVDLAKRAVVDRWPLTGCDGPSGLSLDTANRRLFIACARSSALLVMNADTHSVVASVKIGAEPDSVAFDPQNKRIYSTGKQGILSIVQQDSADTYRNIGNVTLEYGAHTLAVDPSTHRVYVGYVSLFTSPRLAVFDAQ